VAERVSVSGAHLVARVHRINTGDGSVLSLSTEQGREAHGAWCCAHERCWRLTSHGKQSPSADLLVTARGWYSPSDHGPWRCAVIWSHGAFLSRSTQKSQWCQSRVRACVGVEAVWVWIWAPAAPLELVVSRWRCARARRARKKGRSHLSGHHLHHQLFFASES
jgi:hypothetical protein